MGDVCTPNPAAVLLIDDIFEMEPQGFVVGRRFGDPFGDLNDDGTEARSV